MFASTSSRGRADPGPSVIFGDSVSLRLREKVNVCKRWVEEFVLEDVDNKAVYSVGVPDYMRTVCLGDGNNGQWILRRGVYRHLLQPKDTKKKNANITLSIEPHIKSDSYTTSSLSCVAQVSVAIP